MLAMIYACFSTIFTSVNSTFFLPPPPKVPFLFENARENTFLRCTFLFSGMLGMIYVNFSFVLKSVNETYFDPPPKSTVLI